MGKKNRAEVWICAAIAAAILLVYGQVHEFEFVNFDDDEYVYENPSVLGGLTWSSVQWAFTTPHAANWHPLTWISHMLDVELFGLWAGGHHLTNVAWHVGASLLLFGWLRRSTGSRWRSAVVAMLFALHPLHVESVAWVSERKDVLCAFFWMATTLAYVEYVRRPTFARWLSVAFVFVVALLAKPMAVTLPFTLLLLDVWPLARIADRHSALRCAIEKVPLLAISAAAGAVTFVVQRAAGAVAPADSFPLSYRIGNAFVSYAEYLRMTVWPAGLAVFYPAPTDLLIVHVLQAAIVLVGLAAVVAIVRSAYLFVGLAWFAGTLVPVIGLVKQGEQAMADRFTYVPHVGLFVAVVWGAAELWSRATRSNPQIDGGPRGAIAATLAVLAVLGVVAHRQVSHWRNTRTLFEHAIEVTEGNFVAHLNLSAELLAAGDTLAALSHIDHSVRINPSDTKARATFGAVLAALGRYDEAIAQYREAIRIEPNAAVPHFNLGLALTAKSERTAAIAALQRAIELDPEHAKARTQLASLLVEEGQLDEAIAQYRRALSSNPHLPAAHNNLAMALERKGDADGAFTHYKEAVRLAPDEPFGHANLAQVLAARGEKEQAMHEWREALRLARARGLADLAADMERQLRDLEASR